MNRYFMKALLGCVAAAAALSTAGTALAVPYASSVTSDGGTGFNFILNGNQSLDERETRQSTTRSCLNRHFPYDLRLTTSPGSSRTSVTPLGENPSVYVSNTVGRPRIGARSTLREPQNPLQARSARTDSSPSACSSVCPSMRRVMPATPSAGSRRTGGSDQGSFGTTAWGWRLRPVGT